MSIVFILPGLLLITLGLVALFGLGSPEAKPALSLVRTENEGEFELAA